MVAEPAKVTRIEEGRIRLIGCSTGAANSVKEHLARIDRPAKVSRFLDWMERATFGWAGAHAHEADWCFFALSAVVKATGMSRYAVVHSRQWLVNARIIWYDTSNVPIQSNGKGPDGRIGWNLAYDEWTPPLHGGAREGAGRPRKQQTAIANLNTEQPPIANLNLSDSQQPGEKMGRDQDSSTLIHEIAGDTLAIGNISSQQWPLDKMFSSQQCQPATDVFKSAMDASLEASAAQAPEGAVIIPSQKNKRRKKEEPSIDQAGLPEMEYTEEELSLLKVLRTLPACAPTSKLDRHLLNTLLYVEKKPLPWLLHQASIMVAWALKHPKRCCDQAYFIRWCSFPAATEDYERWQQQEAAKTQRNGQSASQRPTTEDDRAALAASRASIAAQKAGPREKSNYLR